jgi:hypothetical protein
VEYIGTAPSARVGGGAPDVCSVGAWNQSVNSHVNGGVAMADKDAIKR